MAIERTKAHNVGLSDTGQKIAKWLRPLFFARAQQPNKITVAHYNINNKKEPIASFDIEETPDEKELIVLANDLEGAGFDDAEGLGGLQRYIIHAYVDDKTEPVARFPFRIRNSDEEDGDPIDSEPATPKGLVSQAQRHAEAAVKMSLGASGQIIVTLQRQLSRQADTIEKLTEQRAEFFDMLENLRNEKQTRDIEMQDATLKANIKKDAYDKLAMLAPVIVNKLAGQKILPERITPTEQMLKSLAGSIRPEQMDAFRSILGPEQLILLVEFMQSTQDKEESTSLVPTEEKKDKGE